MSAWLHFTVRPVFPTWTSTSTFLENVNVCMASFHCETSFFPRGPVLLLFWEMLMSAWFHFTVWPVFPTWTSIPTFWGNVNVCMASFHCLTSFSTLMSAWLHFTVSQVFPHGPVQLLSGESHNIKEIPKQWRVIGLMTIFNGSSLSLNCVGLHVWPTVDPLPHLSNEVQGHFLL